MSAESWQTEVSLEVLQARDTMLRALRSYFEDSGAIEVTTPTMATRGVTDCHIDNLSVQSADQIYFLQTSPEYAMKKLLARYPVAMFQVCQAYRGGEKGERHNPEFTMLEWYRPGFTLEQLMDDTQGFLDQVATALSYPLSRCRRASYASLYEDRWGMNPHLASDSALRDIAHAVTDCSHIEEHKDAGTRADYFDLIFSEAIEPDLVEPTIIYDYPACQSALARISLEDGVARRFEVFINGLELANGYDELVDATELAGRMESNNRLRATRGLDQIEPDRDLVQALEHLSQCAGIAVGLDRLLMALTGKRQILDVVTFT